MKQPKPERKSASGLGKVLKIPAKLLGSKSTKTKGTAKPKKTVAEKSTSPKTTKVTTETKPRQRVMQKVVDAAQKVRKRRAETKARKADKAFAEKIKKQSKRERRAQAAEARRAMRLKKKAIAARMEAGEIFAGIEVAAPVADTRKVESNVVEEDVEQGPLSEAGEVSDDELAAAAGLDDDELHTDEDTEIETEQAAPQADAAAQSQNTVPSMRTSRAYEATNDPTSLYLREIGFREILTHEQEIALMRRIRRKDTRAMHEMVESNLRLVVKIARRYCNRGVAYLDLIEEGNLGLMHAIEKYDEERGFRFSTYATWWIKQSIERAIMNQSRTIRLPVHVVKELTVYLRAGQKLAREKGTGSVNEEELAKALDKPLEDIQKILSLKQDATSLDINLADDSDTTLVDTVASDQPQDPYSILHSIDVHDDIASWLDTLEEKERTVLIYRFGMLGQDRLTLEEVSQKMGFARERVRQIQLRALKKLRIHLEEQGISSGDAYMEE